MAVKEGFARKPPRAVRRRPRVLVIHGHDELNLLRLKEAIRETLRCIPVLLSDKPALGRTIIEKFEEIATDVVFAVALLTPDDRIGIENKQYFQARPNVLFELGWLYARLGRSRVSILFRRGAELPSDLDGVNRFDFTDNVLDVLPQLKAELQSIGMLKSA